MITVEVTETHVGEYQAYRHVKTVYKIFGITFYIKTTNQI